MMENAVNVVFVMMEPLSWDERPGGAFGSGNESSDVPPPCRAEPKCFIVGPLTTVCPRRCSNIGCFKVHQDILLWRVVKQPAQVLEAAGQAEWSSSVRPWSDSGEPSGNQKGTLWDTREGPARWWTRPKVLTNDVRWNEAGDGKQFFFLLNIPK